MQIPKKDKDTLAYMNELMQILEQNKKAMPQVSKEEAQSELETFALQVFSFADNEDRAGHHSMQIVKAFFDAVLFFEVCSQFGELAGDLQEKQKYAAWKAA